MTRTRLLNRRVLSLCACMMVFSMPLVSAQDRSRYRDYQIGDDLRTISEHSGAARPMARIIPHEPVVLQELEWRPQVLSRLGATNRCRRARHVRVLRRPAVPNRRRLRPPADRRHDRGGYGRGVFRDLRPAIPTSRARPCRCGARWAGRRSARRQLGRRGVLSHLAQNAGFLGVQTDRGVHPAWGPGPGCWRGRSTAGFARSTPCTQRRRRGRPRRSREVEAGQQGGLQAVTVYFIAIRSLHT